jgi:4-hydroxy-2-oxoheptanedioate aldolase
MQTNTTKAKLKAGETVYGCFVRYPDDGLAEFVALQGWDFLVFDAEHGTIQPADCQNMVRAAELRGVTPIGRVTTNQPHIVLRFMDTGLQGVHVPWVNSAEEAERAVQSVKYHPRGVRGLAGSRAADYGQSMPLAEYIKQANDETLVVIHIETEQAANQIEEVLTVPDIDVIFIGPTDLSHSMSVTGQKDHPKLTAAIDRVVDAVQKTDIAFGAFVGTPEAALEWKSRGARYLATGLEGLIKSASGDYLGQLRG